MALRERQKDWPVCVYVHPQVDGWGEGFASEPPLVILRLLCTGTKRGKPVIIALSFTLQPGF